MRDRIDTLTPLAAPTLPRSYTSQLLTAIANQLDAGTPGLVLTPRTWSSALDTAVHLVVDGLPQPVHTDALAGLMRVGIDFRPMETAGERSLRLRAAARTL